MNRHRFVAGGASAAALTAAPLTARLAFAEDSAKDSFAGGVGSSVATTIASNLAESAIGTGLDAIGLGSVWSFLSGSPSDQSAQILAKLDRISQQLQDLSTQIRQLQQDIKAQFEQENFDTVVAPVQSLMTANETLKQDYQDLFQGVANGSDVSGTLLQIPRDLALVSGGMNEWHIALTGATRTSVIKAASLVSNTNPDLYTQQSAARFQGLWDLFDAQQAMTMVYYVEYLHASKQSYRIMDRLRAYLANRQQQLAMLRGQQRDVAEVMTLTVLGRPRFIQGRFTGPALPPNTIVARKPPYLMWYLQLQGPITQGNATYDVVCRDGSDVAHFENNTADAARAQFNNRIYLVKGTLEFSRATGPQVESLISAAGGTENDNGQGHFVDALGALGFVFPPNVSNIWALPAHNQQDPRITDAPVLANDCFVSAATPSQRRAAGRFFSGSDLYREGDSPQLPSSDPNVVGASIYVRPTMGEYFYQDSRT